MAETCVLGHAWTPGRVLCAVCGFGPRALQPGQGAAAVTQSAVTAEPELATAGASARMGRGLQLDEQAAVTTSYQEPAAPELTLSPDGQWAWNGTEWVPAPPPPETAPQADLLPESAPRRSRRRRSKDSPEASAVADVPTHAKTGRAGADPKLLILLVLVLAIAAAADFALKLPPLGHKATPVSSVVTPGVHAPGTVKAFQPTHAVAAPKHAVKGVKALAPSVVSNDMQRVSGAELVAYPKQKTFVTDTAQLSALGSPVVGGIKVLVAANTDDYCVVAGGATRWWAFDGKFNDGVIGTLRYASSAAAESNCTAGLGAFHALA